MLKREDMSRGGKGKEKKTWCSCKRKRQELLCNNPGGKGPSSITSITLVMEEGTQVIKKNNKKKTPKNQQQKKKKTQKTLPPLSEKSLPCNPFLSETVKL